MANASFPLNNNPHVVLFSHPPFPHLLSSSAAVDYLTKNVSLSTQRRMKLGEHSAVLGLLPVETGQAY